MRTVAGGAVLTEPYFHTADPARKVAAPSDELAAWVEANTFECTSFRARISRQQCEANRERGLFLCGLCTQVQPVAPPPAKRRGRPWKTAEKVGGGGGDVESFAAEQHFRQQEDAYHRDNRISALLRDPIVLDVLIIMARRGNHQAANILAERDAR